VPAIISGSLQGVQTAKASGVTCDTRDVDRVWDYDIYTIKQTASFPLNTLSLVGKVCLCQW